MRRQDLRGAGGDKAFYGTRIRNHGGGRDMRRNLLQQLQYRRYRSSQHDDLGAGNSLLDRRRRLVERSQGKRFVQGGRFVKADNPNVWRLLFPYEAKGSADQADANDGNALHRKRRNRWALARGS